MENDERFQAVCEAAGCTIRALRVARGLTQEALALRVGMGWRHLQKIEAGEVNLTLRTICRFAAALQVDIPVFFDKSTRSAPDAQA
jgi:transcriptional regulator with XRE-family HTH domain